MANLTRMDAHWMDTGVAELRVRDVGPTDAPASGPLPMPVRILWGAGDRTHRPTPPDSVKALVPGVRVEVIPTAGHSPELEHPDRLLALLGD